MECMENKKFKIGQNVYVLQRKDGEAVNYHHFLFLAQVGNAAILSRDILLENSIDKIMQDAIEDTQYGFEVGFSVYPISDCYETEEEANAQLKEPKQERKQNEVVDAILSVLEKFKEE